MMSLYSKITDELDRIIYITPDMITNQATLDYLDIRGPAPSLIYVSRQDVVRVFIDGEAPL